MSREGNGAGKGLEPQELKTGLVLNLHCIGGVISPPSTLSCLVECSRGCCRGHHEWNKLQSHHPNYSYYREEKDIKQEEARGCKTHMILVNVTNYFRV